MSMPGVEEVLAQMKAKLQADLPAKVAALNSEYDDGCEITVPASYLRKFDPADQAELETDSEAGVATQERSPAVAG